MPAKSPRIHVSFALRREAEPREQCVPRQSPGTRNVAVGPVSQANSHEVLPLQSGQAQKVFQHTYNYVRETALLESTLALLEWDERTGLPANAGDHRAQQVTFLSGLVHQRKTSAQFGDWLNELARSELALQSNAPVGASIRGMKRDFDKNIQLPESLVKQIAHAVTIGQQVWSIAKPKNDFAAFLPHLEAIVQLRREEASILSKGDCCLYDSLLDQYEEDAKTDEVRSEERRVGKECNVECRSRWSPYH